MDMALQTPVKDISVEQELYAFSNIKISKPAAGLESNDAIPEQCEDSNSDEYAAWGVKRLAGHRTIEGSPLSGGFPSKRLDPKETPNCFKSDKVMAQTEVETPLKSEPHCLLVSTTDSPALDRVKKLLVVNTASASLVHDTGDHQENHLRTEQIAGPSGCLRRLRLGGSIMWQAEEDIIPAALTDILRVHEYSYLAHLEAKVKQSVLDNNCNMPPFYAPIGCLDIDTPLSVSSLDAAKRFCGGAMLAVDKILGDGAAECLSGAAFVIGRPPGHHAGPAGCVPPPCFWQRPDMTSSGFCLLNTVAVAAAHARASYAIADNGTVVRGHPVNSRPLKIAIVDIDIHHGNGTEEIVRNLSPRSVYLPLPSSWAPVTVPSYKPWYNENDAMEVFFSSIHLYGGPAFYPCSGDENLISEIGVQMKPPCIVNICLTPIGPGTAQNTLSKKAKTRNELSNKQRADYCAIASAELRSKVSQRLLPSLVAFAPDLVLISSGFDAHYDDMYHYLNEDDFHWLTKSLSDTCPRIVSVMEGGYSLKPVILSGVPEQSSQTQFDRFAILSPQKDVAAASNKPMRGKAVLKPAALNTADSAAAPSALSIAFDDVSNQGTDGGLIKAVLAHACALTSRDSWN